LPVGDGVAPVPPAPARLGAVLLGAVPLGTVLLGTVPGMADPEPGVCGAVRWPVVWDSSVVRPVLPPPSAPFTVQVTSASMPRPATRAMTLRRQ